MQISVHLVSVFPKENSTKTENSLPFQSVLSVRGRMSQALSEGEGGREGGEGEGRRKREGEQEQESERPTLALISSELPCPRLLALGRQNPARTGLFVSSGPRPEESAGPALPTSRAPTGESLPWRRSGGVQATAQGRLAAGPSWA